MTDELLVHLELNSIGSDKECDLRFRIPGLEVRGLFQFDFGLYTYEKLGLDFLIVSALANLGTFTRFEACSSSAPDMIRDILQLEGPEYKPKNLIFGIYRTEIELPNLRFCDQSFRILSPM